MLIERDELCLLIPHGNRMCLLDEVLFWNEETIICGTLTHVDPDNPLRTSSGLSSLHAIEYGAQAMAIHGGLIARDMGKALQTAYLAGLRQVTLSVDWLNDYNMSLTVEAKRLFSIGDSLIYEFYVKADDDLLVQGRITVIGGIGG